MIVPISPSQANAVPIEEGIPLQFEMTPADFVARCVMLLATKFTKHNHHASDRKASVQ